jgi:hypothetical protein
VYGNCTKKVERAASGRHAVADGQYKWHCTTLMTCTIMHSNTHHFITQLYIPIHTTSSHTYTFQYASLHHTITHSNTHHFITSVCPLLHKQSILLLCCHTLCTCKHCLPKLYSITLTFLGL